MLSKRQIPYLMAWWITALAPGAFGNVVGSDLQNFNTAPGGIDYVTVQSSETLQTGFFNLGLMGNHAVNSLPHFSDEGSQDRLRTGDTLTMGDVALGIGVMQNLEIGGAGQYLARQTVNPGEERAQFSTTGFIDYRLYAKWRALAGAGGGVAFITSGLFNRVRNNPYIGRGGSDIGIVEAVADTKIIGINLALNVGYRFRKKGEPIPGYLLQPVGNEYIASCGMSYLLPFIDTKLIVEAFGSRPAERSATGLGARQRSTAELLGGVKHDLSDNLALHAGMGTELIHGVSSPDWRVYAGVNWAMEPAAPREPPPAAMANAGTPPAPPVQLKPVAPHEERATLHNLNFTSGSAEIPPEGIAVLTAVAAEINASSFDKIIVEGHTDSVGRANYNLELSKQRAEAVRDWLIQNARIPAEKIEAAGYGASRPLADNGNLQGRALNRRVELRVQRTTNASASPAAVSAPPSAGGAPLDPVHSMPPKNDPVPAHP